MKLSIDKRILKAGSVIEVQWDNSGGANQELVVHTGNRESVLPVTMSGSKRLRMKGGHLLCWIGLRTQEYGRVRTLRRYFLVYGKGETTDRFEYVGTNPSDSRLEQAKSAMRRWWNAYTPEKQRLLKILGIILVYEFVLPRNPGLASIVLTILVFYIFWQVIKR